MLGANADGTRRDAPYLVDAALPSGCVGVVCDEVEDLGSRSLQLDARFQLEPSHEASFLMVGLACHRVRARSTRTRRPGRPRRLATCRPGYLVDDTSRYH